MLGGSYGTRVPDSTMVTIFKEASGGSSTYNGPQIIGVKFNPLQSAAPHTTLIGPGRDATNVRHAVVQGNTFQLNHIARFADKDRMSVELHPTALLPQNHNKISGNTGVDWLHTWPAQTDLWSSEVPDDPDGQSPPWKPGQRVWNSLPLPGAPLGWVYGGGTWVEDTLDATDNKGNPFQYQRMQYQNGQWLEMSVL